PIVLRKVSDPWKTGEINALSPTLGLINGTEGLTNGTEGFMNGTQGLINRTAISETNRTLSDPVDISGFGSCPVLCPSTNVTTIITLIDGTQFLAPVSTCFEGKIFNTFPISIL
ncbi:uncharacterized protein LOC103522264, partial [Diaphorina citri]|uniref:Uncharacterized protein LOC103522264 n=1 Tax=Diaphorina citri TaxID=121845 RepID=A0A3Q0JIV8_DIACI